MNADPHARTETLRRTLEGRSVNLMGRNSPFWRCEYCDAMATSPLLFPHKPECLLASERPNMDRMVCDGI
jgi:hypothetical protein